jgi:hypothetical protein
VARKPHVMTPARKTALKKAQAVAAANKRASHHRYIPREAQRASRGVGVAGFKKNATPYVRMNKRSVTVGGNAGTIIPGRNSRVVLGGYARVENTKRKTPVDRALDRALTKAAPWGSKRSRVRKWLKKNVQIVQTPTGRINIGNKAEGRFSTSRSSGVTLVVRKGKHKASKAKSNSGVRKYNRRMHTIQKARGTNVVRRPERRGKGVL